MKQPFAAAGAIAMAAGLLAGTLSFAGASSHREAPAIANDPAADNTDFYMFRSQDDPSTVTLIANYIPFQAPYGGPNFFAPADDVLYSINIDNTGAALADIVYNFRFNTVRLPSVLGGVPGDTYLYNDGPITSLTDRNLLVRTNYTLTRTDVARGVSAVIATGQVAPAFVGKESYCATDSATTQCTEAQAKIAYEGIAASAIVPTSEGGKAFVGPRQDGFYVDLGKVFDLARLGSLGFGTPSNDTAAFNVTTLAIEVPIDKLTTNGDPVIGGWAVASRHSTQVLRTDGSSAETGAQVQISRLGNPLVNELVIGAKDKDKFNATLPANDVANFGDYVVNPRLATILNALYPGLNAKTNNRGDLVQIFVTGIPGLTRPKNLTRGGEMLRLNTAIPVTSAAIRNDLGVLGGDAQGFPNGRRVTDDVVDTALTAVAFTSCSGPSEAFGATLPCTGPALGDGVSKSSPVLLAFTETFPFLPTPLSGTQ